MNKLKLKNLVVDFLEDNHTYTVGGKLLTGVTTILNVRAKDFLKWWPVKLMWENLTGKFKEILAGTEKEFETRILDAKKAHTVKSKEALSSGKVAHDWIEEYIKARIAGQECADVHFPDDEKAATAVKAFLDWQEKHEIEWLASELVLASTVDMFAGTIDFVARIDGVLTLGDFKTSSVISEDSYLQTAAYFYLLDENLLEGEERPTQRLVLRIPKDGTEFESRIVPTPLDFDILTFLRCREIHRWNLLIKSLEDNKITIKI